MNSAHRRERLESLIAKRFKGDRQAFLLKTKYTKGRLTQLLDKDEPFGERAAREVERRIGLPALWLDVGDEALPGYPSDGRLLVPVSIQEEKLLMYFKLLSPIQREKMVNDAREQAYAKSITERVKGSAIKDHSSDVAVEMAYGLPRERETGPE